jgi:hypothetical protein
MQFSRAERKRAKLRLALSGPSGSGKTYGALLIAKGLGGRIAVIDTEHGSASLYSHLCQFDDSNLTKPYTPEKYIEGIRTAESQGYNTLIIDSITHEWSGSGGCLEINEMTGKTKYKGNSWAAWGDTTPRHRAFLDAIQQSPMHIIATMRAKTDTVQENGKVRKIGMKDEQRDGTEYEFTIAFNLIHGDMIAVASKDRSELFKEPHIITPDTGRRLREWLESGKAVEPAAPQTLANPTGPTAQQLERLAAARVEWLKTLGVDPDNKEVAGIEWRGKLHFYGVTSAKELTSDRCDALIGELSGNAPTATAADNDFPA